MDLFWRRAVQSKSAAEDLQEAFLNAKVAVAQWEVRDGLTPSNPQGHFGAALMDKLAPLYSYRNSATAMKSATAP